MSSEILINATPHETRVAVVENEVLQELYLERTATRGVYGNIYLGRVARVVPGMQAAFIDISLECNGFLHVKDIYPRNPRMAEEADKLPQISDVLHEGETVIVQVIKEPVGNKGARLSCQLALTARNLVYFPNRACVNVSQRIRDAREKERLQTILGKLVDQRNIEGGVIVRTSAKGGSEDMLAAELAHLTDKWRKILDIKAKSKAPVRLYEDLPLAQRLFRDTIDGDVEKVWIDSELAFESAVSFAAEVAPALTSKCELYSGDQALFDMYSVEQEIERALHSRVELEGGGYLVIEPTVAMTVVDVNSGSHIGKRNLENTALETNLAAASAIARQLRLRNTGGIIVIDFIDMLNNEHKQQVLGALKLALKRDSVKTLVSKISTLGLVEITRLRTRDSLAYLMMERCLKCKGRGSVKSAQTVCYQIFREIKQEFRQYQANEYMIRASNDVIVWLSEAETSSLADIQSLIERPVRLQVDAHFQREYYEIVPS